MNYRAPTAITLPYLTTENEVSFDPLKLFADINSLSAHNLDAPYKLIGEEALSVESKIHFLTWFLLKLIQHSEILIYLFLLPL